jgi:hypothetical protein
MMEIKRSPNLINSPFLKVEKSVDVLTGFTRFTRLENQFLFISMTC